MIFGPKEQRPFQPGIKPQFTEQNAYCKRLWMAAFFVNGSCYGGQFR